MAGTIETVGVVGLGQMGAGIVEVLARSGLTVVGVEPTADGLERGRGHLHRSTDRMVAKGRLTADDQAALLARVTLTTDLTEVRDCDLVVEAVPEVLGLKQAVLAEIDRTCSPGTVLATNTSSLSVTEIAMATQRPDRVIGMHFFNPAPVMRLVEVVRTIRTDPGVVEAVLALAARLGKTTVSVTDRAGFVANTLLLGYLNEAASMLERGVVASRDDLDDAVRLGTGLPMGPLALLDLIGIDTVVEILDTIHHETASRRFAAAPLLRRMATGGRLGRKAGGGFFGGDAAPTARPDEQSPAGQPVRRVAVVGAAADVGALRARCEAAGIDTVHVDLDADREPTADDLAALAACDVAVDVAGAERDQAAAVQARQRRVRLLVEAIGPDGVVATTSPTVTATVAGATARRPARVVGLRLHAPPGGGTDSGTGGGVAEVARSVVAADDAVGRVRELGHLLTGRAVVVADQAGGVVGRLVLGQLGDAARMVGEGYASADDVDAAMTLGCGYPEGPVAQLDRLGADVVVRGLEAVHAETGEPHDLPAPLLRRLVASGSALTGRPG